MSEVLVEAKRVRILVKLSEQKLCGKNYDEQNPLSRSTISFKKKESAGLSEDVCPW